MKKRVRNASIILLWLVLLHPAGAGRASDQWTFLAQGVEYGIFNNRLHIVRMDPGRAKLKLLLASQHDRKLRTTADWCRDFNLIAAINAGMYGTDYLTNVGYLRNGSHVQNRRWSSKYKSVLAFDPKKQGLPPAVMIDLDDPDAKAGLKDYRAVVQNLRLMKGNGINVWERTDRRWSEAAVGMDRQGRILFLFCRVPYPMREFNEMVKSLGLGVTHMMHMEGGPVAGLSIRAGHFNLDISGSYETGSQTAGANGEQWPIPNVIGIQQK